MLTPSAPAKAMAVRERPIIFSAPMVRAILAGRKTQTRRVVKELRCLDPDGDADDRESLRQWGEEKYGAPGDRLWVREALEATEDDVWYRADDTELDVLNAPGRPRVWEYSEGVISPIHMPRWASRITLEVVSVRVERVQDISEADARAEGAPFYVGGHGPITDAELNADPGYSCSGNYRGGFEFVWEQINGKAHPWTSNPWTWCITFKRLAGSEASC